MSEIDSLGDDLRGAKLVAKRLERHKCRVRAIVNAPKHQTFSRLYCLTYLWQNMSSFTLNDGRWCVVCSTAVPG